MGQALSLCGFIAVPLGFGLFGGISQAESVKSWYPLLKKPSWNPPNWLFGPMWTLLYTGMGVASWLVAKQGIAKHALPLSLYGVQLAFNIAWTHIFFVHKRPGWALADIIAMDITAVATAISFYPVNPISAYLLVPYLGWGLFATALNYRIMVDNPNASQLGKDETDKPILDTTIPGAD